MKKTLAQLKRDLTVGKKLKTILALHKQQEGTIREIVRTNTVGVFLKTYKKWEDIFDKRRANQDENGYWVESELIMPKNKELVEYEDNVITFYAPRKKTEEERKRDFEELHRRYGENYIYYHDTETERLKSNTVYNEKGRAELKYEILEVV